MAAASADAASAAVAAATATATKSSTESLSPRNTTMAAASADAASDAVAAATTKSSTESEPITLLIIYSSGDLGDVGRHAIAAALEFPPTVVRQIRALSTNIKALEKRQWKCGCEEQHSVTESDRLQLIQADCTTVNLDQYMEGVSAVVSCLGNRRPFHDDCVAKLGTQGIVQAVLRQRVTPRFVMLSSVGIAEDWPPMEWCREGQRLQGFFRTICWMQYQDLSGAELAIQQGAQTNEDFNFLIVRSVILDETTRPVGGWYVQVAKHKDHPPCLDLAKMDCARFMVEEAITPSIRRRAVVLGGVPAPVPVPVATTDPQNNKKRKQQHQESE
jgi:hypothetical protein